MACMNLHHRTISQLGFRDAAQVAWQPCRRGPLVCRDHPPGSTLSLISVKGTMTIGHTGQTWRLPFGCPLDPKKGSNSKNDEPTQPQKEGALSKRQPRVRVGPHTGPILWMDNHGKPLLAAIYTKMVIPGFLRWCSISSIHGIYSVLAMAHVSQTHEATMGCAASASRARARSRSLCLCLCLRRLQPPRLCSRPWPWACVSGLSRGRFGLDHV